MTTDRNKLLELAKEAGFQDGWVNLWAANFERFASLLSAAQAEREPTIPDELFKIGELLRTQDNRITDQPMFIVQQKRQIVGIDPEYLDGDQIGWFDADGMATPEEHASLEAGYQEDGLEPDGWTRTGYANQWEFVTACFTEQGCKDYLARDGHNLKEPRIYAEGSYRNVEFRLLRDWLRSLKRPSQVQEPTKHYSKFGSKDLCDKIAEHFTPSASGAGDELPPPPEPDAIGKSGLYTQYTFRKLREYARAAVALYRAKQAAQSAQVPEDVLDLVYSGDLEQVLFRAGEEDALMKLYRARQSLTAPQPDQGGDK